MSGEQRPWGTFRIIEQGFNYKIKHITIFSHKRTSLQLHEYRAELMVVIDGVADIVVNDKNKQLKLGDYCFIHKRDLHRIQNNGEEELNIIEVQMGDKLDEEDIVRFHDDYGRI